MLMGNKDNGKQPLPKVAVMPSPPRPKHQHTDIGANHPAVAEHIARFNEMAIELDRLRADNARLANELEIERRVNNELQHSVDVERNQKERYQRYAVRADSFFEQLATTANQARDESHRMAAAAEPPKPLEPPPSVDELEAGVAEIAKKFAPKQDQPDPQ
jgi:hypothetical protein